ncbi:hypothetical protein Bca101_026677 [Brassica carinata]
MPIVFRVWIKSLLDDFELPGWFDDLGLWVFHVTAIKSFQELNNACGGFLVAGLNYNHHQSLGYVNQRLRDNRMLLTFLRGCC